MEEQNWRNSFLSKRLERLTDALVGLKTEPRFTESGEIGDASFVSPSVHVNACSFERIERRVSVDFVVLDSGYCFRVVSYVLERELRDRKREEDVNERTGGHLVGVVETEQTARVHSTPVNYEVPHIHSIVLLRSSWEESK